MIYASHVNYMMSNHIASTINYINPDRPETLKITYERIDELQKNLTEISMQLTASKDDALIPLCHSDCEDVCYHIGYCSDAMNDWCEPPYNEFDIHAKSNKNHHHKKCDDCNKWIENLCD
jgi:hypothetical protein